MHTLLSQEQMEEIVASVRGSNQRDWARDLAEGRGLADPRRDLRGRAKQYAGRYSASWHRVLERIRSLGYHIVVLPGPRGGRSAALHFIAEAVVDAAGLAIEMAQRGAPEDAKLLIAMDSQGLSLDQVLCLLEHEDEDIRELGLMAVSRLRSAKLATNATAAA